MTTALSILFLALLFGVYGLLRPRAGCGGNCGACAKACHSNTGHDHV